MMRLSTTIAVILLECCTTACASERVQCDFPSLDATGHDRQSTTAVSLSLPRDVRRQDYQATDSEFHSWHAPGFEIQFDYGVGVGPLRRLGPPHHECGAVVDGYPVVVGVWKRDGKRITNGFWHQVGHGDNALSVTVEEVGDEEGGDRNALRVLASVRFINSAESLKLVEVFPNREPPVAVIVDETGERKTVELEEAFTRDRGWFSEIRADGATVTEWRHDPDDGWHKIEYEMSLRPAE